MKKVELLAPAGDLEKLKWAIDYGADAVYIGGPSLGLRANAKNFTFDEIQTGCIYAHERNKKVYVTVNIVLHNEEANQVKDFLQKIEKCGVDAIIVSDPYIVSTAKKYTSLEVHISTQQSVLNKETAQFFKDEGATRVVLARETKKEEIKEILDNVDIEIECFIHGAMCASISGRCVLSNFLTNRDANRGGCSQICRWDFDLKNSKNEELNGDEKFTFCSKDLSMLKYIPDMIDMGITSLKIEGRMRSVYYIATVVDVYRKAIDSYYANPKVYQYDKNLETVLRNCANRDSVPQFFDGTNNETCGYYNGREEISNQDFLGVVLDYDSKTKYATVEQRNYFKLNDEIEIFGPNLDAYDQIVTDIIDEDGNHIDIVRHPRQIVKIKVDRQLSPNNLIRKKIKNLTNI